MGRDITIAKSKRSPTRSRKPDFALKNFGDIFRLFEARSRRVSSRSRVYTGRARGFSGLKREAKAERRKNEKVKKRGLGPIPPPKKSRRSQAPKKAPARRKRDQGLMVPELNYVRAWKSGIHAGNAFFTFGEVNIEIRGLSTNKISKGVSAKSAHAFKRVIEGGQESIIKAVIARSKRIILETEPDFTQAGVVVLSTSKGTVQEISGFSPRFPGDMTKRRYPTVDDFVKAFAHARRQASGYPDTVVIKEFFIVCYYYAEPVEKARLLHRLALYQYKRGKHYLNSEEKRNPVAAKGLKRRAAREALVILHQRFGFSLPRAGKGE